MKEERYHLALDKYDKNSLCDPDEHKRVQRYAKTCLVTASDERW